MRWVLAFCSISAALAMFCPPISAQNKSEYQIENENRHICGDKNLPVERRIPACTEVTQSSLENNDTHSGAYWLRGSLYQSKQDYVRAIADFSEAFRLDPQFGLALISRGDVYQALGYSEQALADYNEGVELSSWSELGFIARGNFYRSRKDYSRAVADFDMAIRNSHKGREGDEYEFEHGIIFAYRGLAYFGQGRAAQALIDFGKAIQLDPKNALAFRGRGLLGLRQQNFHAAWEDYNRAVQLDPMTADALFGRGVAALGFGQKLEGEADMAKAKNLDPNVAAEFAEQGVMP